MKYAVGDGYTYYADITLPIEYESAEALICDFEKTIDEAFEKRIHKHHCNYAFEFGIEKFNISDFCDNAGNKTLPEILTIEEWFEQNNINP